LRLSGGNSKDKNPEVNKEVNNVMNRPWKVRVFSRVELS
jgi:fructose-bisphosphate aldolase class 1